MAETTTTPAAAAPAAAAPTSTSIADPAPAAAAKTATSAPVPAADPKTGDSTPAGQAAAEPAKATDPAKPVEAVKADPAKAEPPAELTLKMPEGFQADTKALDAFKGVAKELGLKSESAQKIFDLYAKSQTDAATAAQTAHAERTKQWADAVRSDKEIGGANLEATLVHARRAVELAGGDELRKAMNELGIGNHPVVVKAFAKLGRSLGEDSLAGENRPVNGVASRQQRIAAFYDDMQK